MSKKLLNNVIAVGAMVVLSIGIVVGIKFTNGDFGAKDNAEALDVSAFSNENATVLEAARLYGSDEATTGYTVTVTSVGFNAAEPVEMKVSFDAEKANITNLEIIAQNETPGFGANVENEDFLAQFTELAAPVYTTDMDATGTSFDQISGATFTSKAVANAVNAAYEFLGTTN